MGNSFFKSRASNVYETIIKLITEHNYTTNDYIIKSMIEWLQHNPENDRYLHLQKLIKGVIDEDVVIQMIDINLMINKNLLTAKWKYQYDGMNAIEFAKNKEMKPFKVINYLKNK